jgi:hypothetical protein
MKLLSELDASGHPLDPNLDCPIQFKLKILQSWKSQTNVEEGDKIRVIGVFSNKNHYTLSLGFMY